MKTFFSNLKTRIYVIFNLKTWLSIMMFNRNSVWNPWQLRWGAGVGAMDAVSNMEESVEVSSPGTPDSRKRPLDVDTDDVMSKRSHYIPGGISNVYFMC